QQFSLLSKSLGIIKYDPKTEKTLGPVAETEELNMIEITKDLSLITITNLDNSNKPLVSKKFKIQNHEINNDGDLINLVVERESEGVHLFSLFISKNVLIEKVEYDDEAYLLVYKILNNKDL
ncbi:hypothetical protein, partial [Chryseobacterium sp. HMWF001]